MNDVPTTNMMNEIMKSGKIATPQQEISRKGKTKKKEMQLIGGKDRRT